MTAAEVKAKLSTQDIIKLCCSLQESSVEDCLFDAQGHPIFNTVLCHGGDSDKLYYYPETQLFHCYTCSSSYDVFELLHRSRGLELPQAIKFLIQFFNIKNTGFQDSQEEELTDDWDIFQRVKDFERPENSLPVLDSISENLLEYFYPLAAPVEWQREGIIPSVMRAYGIRIDSALSKIIIPHRNANGELIGIRGRAFNPIEIDNGKKYMPVTIQGEIYSHSLGKNLFGLFENKDTIQRIKKVFVVESEKSVLQIASMYGVDQCFAVATCGSSFSKDQMNLLLDLGVEQVILGYDREFHGGKGAPDTTEYEAKLLRVVSPLLPYVNVSVVMDYDHLTNYKDSPTDHGREIFEKLYHQRIRLYTYNEQLRKRRGK